MGEKTSDDMLREAIEAGLFPSMEWDGTEWDVFFSEGDIFFEDKAHGWGGLDESRQRAIKKAYYSWKDMYFNEDVD